MARIVRPIRIEGDVAYVTLTRGLEAIIDVADVPLVEGRNWCALKAPNTFYACSNISRKLGGGTIYLHRILMPGHPEIDHQDGDGLNCRRSNMRAAAHSQNGKNLRLSVKNRSGFKGVSQRKNGRWIAQITVNYQNIYLGVYDEPEVAHAAYVEASRRLHGEFGRVQ